eukprot:scaffold14308_cov169-Isochrysis_galbana.AAC.1
MLWGQAVGWRRWWCKIGGKPVSLRVEERFEYFMFTDASGVGVIREGKAGGVSGAQCGVQGAKAKACASLSFRGRH